jgi:chorismate mutase
MNSDAPPGDTTPPDAKARLAPLRRDIDALDDRIVALLGERFAIVRAVAAIKHRHGIHPVLADRIEEVVGRARDAARRAGFSPASAERVYRALIDESCRLEADIAAALGHAEDGVSADEPPPR